jgi:hypothetical protein
MPKFEETRTWEEQPRTLGGRKKSRGQPQRKHYLAFPWPGEAELELLRHFCVQDFWTFFLVASGAGINPRSRRWIDPKIHYPIAQWFQKHVDEWFHDRRNGVGHKKNLAVLVHRRVGKTTMITRAGQLWIQLRDPELSTFTGSEKSELSAKMLAAMKAVMDGSDPYAMFTRLYGNWSTTARQWTGKEVVHSARRNTARQDPSLGIFGVETSITGGHPDAVFYDDPISYERLDSDTNWLEAVNSQVSSLFPALESDALVVWVGTRYDDGDHFGRGFSDEGVASVTGMQSDSMLVEPETGKWHVYFLAGRDEEGAPTTPTIWSDIEMKRYQKLDPVRYAAQVMNDPSISETNPITRKQIQDCIIPAKEVPWNALRFAITCDTAFARTRYRPGKDWSVFIVHGYPRNGSGDVYVVECQGSPHWRAEDYGHMLVSKVQQYRTQGRKIFAIGDEEESGGKPDAWKIALRNYFADANEPMPAYYQWNRYSGGRKVARIETAATFWVDGHVRVVEGAPGIQMLMDQMAKIGQMRVNPNIHDDFADAHADAFNPELYQPMRRAGQQKAPWERGAMGIEVEGLDPKLFDDDDTATWRRENPREPLRQL